MIKKGGIKYRGYGYRIVKIGKVFYVIDNNEDYRMAKVNCVFSSDEIRRCRNFIYEKKKWFSSKIEIHT